MPFNPVDAAKSLVSKNLGLGSNTSSQFLIDEAPDKLQYQLKTFGLVRPDDWYKIYPYQIVVKNEETNTKYIYTMPIPPESLVSNMVPASGASATLGGVVEETSVNVFWNIQLAGTTGLAVSRDGGKNPNRALPASVFRSTLTTTGLLAGLGSAVESVLGQAQNIVSGFTSPGGLGSSIAGGLAGLSQPPLPYSKSGVPLQSNGHTEILELQRFLYAYSALKDLNPDKWSLYFVNHKDNMKFRAVLQVFNIQKSAQEPYLYRYRIALKGWSATSAGDFTTKNEMNRFQGDLKTVNTLTLTGIASSAGNLIGTIMGGPKSIAGALNLAPSVI